MEEEEFERPSTTRQPIRWEAYEYNHAEKPSEWYWALGLVAIAGCVAALLFNNVLFAILILIAAFVLAVFAAREPNIVQFAVTQRGIRINNKLYPYNTLESFSIEEQSDDGISKLIVNPENFLSPLIIIPIEGVDPDEIHDYLLLSLEEADHTEPLAHRIMEWLGF